MPGRRPFECTLEAMLLRRITAAGIEEPVRQVRAIPGRKFTWDFGWLEDRLLCEVQGMFGVGALGHRTISAHRSIGGFKRDCEKQSLAAAHGFRVVLVERSQIESGKAVEWIAGAMMF